MASYHLRWKDAPGLLAWFVLVGVAWEAVVSPPTTRWPIRVAIGAVAGAVAMVSVEAGDKRYGDGERWSTAVRQAARHAIDGAVLGIFFALWRGHG